jgi:hypothetical protein
MSTVRSGSPGATRVCPHCKATVLESAAICPGCRHHLRFSGNGHALEAGEGYCALSVDGTIAHTQASEPCEYCVVLDVRNARGEQLTRQVIGVGVLQSGELRRLNVSVEMLPVRAHQPAAKTQAPLKPPGATMPAAVRSGAPAAGGAAQGAQRASASPSPVPGGVQQPANLATATAANASMQRLGIIRKPR